VRCEVRRECRRQSCGYHASVLHSDNAAIGVIAGIVDEDIEPTEILHDALDELITSSCFTASTVYASSPLFFDLCDDGVEPFAPARSDYNYQKQELQPDARRAHSIID
jgi:hypothetical protein